MRDVIDIKRFIDDGTGLHIMSGRRFVVWKKQVSDKVAEYGLKIKVTDWMERPEKHGWVNSLDIQYSFDKNKALQTDLFRKPTYSRSYLNFSSCHPNYVCFRKCRFPRRGFVE